MRAVSGSLISQLKQRLNSLKLIAKSVNKKFARQLANALLISKINFNIQIWGNTTKSNINKIDNILYEAARTVLGSEAYGRSKQWLLAQMKWLNTNSNYENSMQNSIFKIINGENEHEFRQYFIENRSIRMNAENKLGPHSQVMGQSIHNQKTFLYRAVALYNNLPKNLTLCKTHSIFKKWCKHYNLNKNVKIPDQVYNNTPRERFLIDHIIIQESENSAD